ncbi:MAG TPA: serine hydrolase domain-containing protein [Chitinophagaceae bacterium]|nr:serine hydrolase domain-containing protein [Chitinophagaceae bacterium]
MKTIYLLGLTALVCSCSHSKDREARKTETVVPYTPPQATLSAQDLKKYSALTANYFDSALRNSSFNGSILVAKNGVVIYEKYTGYKNLRVKDSLTAETPLQIASTSKTLTSAAVLLLVQQGKIALSDSLVKYFPTFPYPEITVKMLLSQRSGLPEYLYFFEKGGWDRKTFASNTDVVNALASWKPGRAYRSNSHFDYCNTNFVLLASLVEKVSGQPFPLFMKKNIFEPLQMRDTYVRTIGDNVQTTNSYEWNGHEWALDFSDGTYGDKNVFSTPRDLLKWDQSLYTNQLLSQQMIDSAFTPYSNEKRSIHNYGLGWRMLVYPSGKKVIYHNGRWHGFNSAFARLVDEKVTIIMLSNKFNKGVYRIARDLYNVFGNYSKNYTELE